jgi:hypothetical protein
MRCTSLQIAPAEAKDRRTPAPRQAREQHMSLRESSWAPKYSVKWWEKVSALEKRPQKLPARPLPDPLCARLPQRTYRP